MRMMALWPQYGPSGALPPGLAGGPAAHPGAHAELEQPREGRRRRAADDQLLQDRQPRVGLHAGDQAQHRRRRHLAVGVEAEHQLGIAGMVVEEVHHVAGLEAGILGAAAVAHGDAAWREGGDGGSSAAASAGSAVSDRNHRVKRSAAPAASSPSSSRASGGSTAPCPRCGCRRRWRCAALAAPGRARRSAGSTAAGGFGARQQDHAADQRIGGAQRGPGRGAGEAGQQQHLPRRPAAGRQHAHRQPEQQRVRARPSRAKVRRRSARGRSVTAAVSRPSMAKLRSGLPPAAPAWPDAENQGRTE